jgi:O-antigen/teichoic acid export membrane protein
MSLAKRSATSVAWNSAASFLTIPIRLVQSILLARFLPVEYFGIFAGMAAVVSLSASVFDFGISGSYVHRAPETEDESESTSIYFTLRFLLSSIWGILLIFCGFLFLDGLHRYVLLVLTVFGYLSKVLETPKVLLSRRVQHRLLAIDSFVTTLLTAVASIFLAYYYRSIWALLASSLITIVSTFIIFYLWKPVWRPKFSWDLEKVKYFINFGLKINISNLISQALDRIDDLWASFYLGDVALGFYSRAYKFATYPRLIVAGPINKVAFGTYSEVKHDRVRLSQAFFRFNALIIRLGFLFAGWLAVVAPNLIPILLGEKWLPMIGAFRLMLVYTLLDPIKVTTSLVLIAVGKPEKVIRVRVIQLIILIVGLYLFGFSLGLNGVALAANVMIIVGTIFLFVLIRPFVDYSLVRLFIVPTFGLLIGLLLSMSVDYFLFVNSTDWVELIVLSIVFIAGYALFVYIFEGKTLYRAMTEIVDLKKLAQDIKSFLPFMNGIE